MSDANLYPRYAESRLVEALADSPVVLIHGPRQCGKATLARVVGAPRDYLYLSFDDDVARGAAEADPVGFVGDLSERAILDEVQRVPALFTAIKTAVDRHRVAGRFILTGSANVLLVPKLADSLAGRMDILRLHPLTQGELARRQPRFLDVLFAGAFRLRSGQPNGSRANSPSGSWRAVIPQRWREPPSGGARLGIATISKPWSSATCAISRASARSTHCRDCCHWPPRRRPGC